jgi:hypothetical protein
MCKAGSEPMRACAAARGPYQEGAYNFVYRSTYILICLKKLQGPAQHVPCGLRRRLDSSRSSHSIAIVTSSIAPASSLRTHTANLGPIYIRLRTHAAHFAKGPAQYRSGPVHVLTFSSAVTRERGCCEVYKWIALALSISSDF